MKAALRLRCRWPCAEACFRRKEASTGEKTPEVLPSTRTRSEICHDLYFASVGPVREPIAATEAGGAEIVHLRRVWELGAAWASILEEFESLTAAVVFPMSSSTLKWRCRRCHYCCCHFQQVDRRTRPPMPFCLFVVCF